MTYNYQGYLCENTMRGLYSLFFVITLTMIFFETDAYAQHEIDNEDSSLKFNKTDVFVGGEKGYDTFRIPVLLSSKKGTLFAFCEGRRNSAHDAGDIDLLLRRSFDGGETWEPIQILHQEEGEIASHNPVAMVDRDTGDIHVIFVRQAREVFYIRSTDNGKTFSNPTNITHIIREMYQRVGFEWSMVHTGPGHGLQMHNGRLVVPLKTMVSTKKAMEEYNGVGRRAGVIFSDNNGETWQAGGVVASDLGGLSEGTIIERRNGSLLFNIRWHDGGFRVVTTSADGGLTWSKPRADPALSDQGSQASMLRYSSKSNNRRVLFSNLPAPFIGYSQRKGLTVQLSYDEGQTWAKSWEVAPGYYTGYSDLMVNMDGRVLILFEAGSNIYSDKIMLAWLDGIIK